MGARISGGFPAPLVTRRSLAETILSSQQDHQVLNSTQRKEEWELLCLPRLHIGNEPGQEGQLAT